MSVRLSNNGGFETDNKAKLNIRYTLKVQFTGRYVEQANI